MALWPSVAERCRLEVDDIVHAATLGGLKDQPAHDGDAVGAHAAEAYQREVIARLGLEVCDAQRHASPRPDVSNRAYAMGWLARRTNSTRAMWLRDLRRCWARLIVHGRG
jgi:hypothetical protein